MISEWLDYIRLDFEMTDYILTDLPRNFKLLFCTRNIAPVSVSTVKMLKSYKQITTACSFS